MTILLRHVILVIVLWFSEPEYWFRNGIHVKGLKIIVLFFFCSNNEIFIYTLSLNNEERTQGIIRKRDSELSDMT
jgi:hypothetical protein